MILVKINLFMVYMSKNRIIEALIPVKDLYVFKMQVILQNLLQLTLFWPIIILSTTLLCQVRFNLSLIDIACFKLSLYFYF